jgi:hypothetical protein
MIEVMSEMDEDLTADTLMFTNNLKASIIANERTELPV